MTENKYLLKRMPDPNDRYRGMYDDEPWAAVATRAGLEPHNTESQARMVAASAADEIALLKDALENLCIGIGMGWDLDGMIEVAQAAIAKAEGRS